MVIWKFNINVETPTRIRTSRNILGWLDLQWQDSSFVVWAAMGEEEGDFSYVVLPVWTGQEIIDTESPITYIGTYQDRRNYLVWHYFAFEEKDNDDDT